MAELPPGLLIVADVAEIARCFPALVPLQPISWTEDGLLCAPRAGTDAAAHALASCPLPHRRLPRVPAWPRTPAGLIAGWYRHGPDHAGAPAGVRELIEDDGEGFGPAEHPTTAMCLTALPTLPDRPGLDAGCGSGLLGQAWVRLTGRATTAIDADARAVDHARRSAALARAGGLTVAYRQIASLTDADLAGRVMFANIPLAAHRTLIGATTAAPEGLVLSGLRQAEAAAVVDEWRRRGLRVARVARRDDWVCWTMMPR